MARTALLQLQDKQLLASGIHWLQWAAQLHISVENPARTALSPSETGW